MKVEKVGNILIKLIFMQAGAILAAVALELFLIPHQIIDGGIVGISIISSYLTDLPLGLYIFILNIPFLIFGYRQIGLSFVLSTLYSVISLSVWVTVLNKTGVFTNDKLLATVFGGIILGIGVGMIIRYGGSLDGTEVVAIILNKTIGFSVGQIVMFFNLFILSSAGLVFGWGNAMYSLIAYFIAFKVIDVVIEGFDEAKAAIIISDKGDEIADVIKKHFGRGVTFLEGKGGYSGQEKSVIYSVITRIEVSKLKYEVKNIDENAFVTINDVFDIMGGVHKKTLKKAH